MKDKILDLFYKGFSYRDICKTLGCAKSTVSYHLKELRNFSIEELRNTKTTACALCGAPLNLRPSKIRKNNFCSISHKSKYFAEYYKEESKIWGLKSANAQRNNRRSKNEIHFYNLCNSMFTNVQHNEQIFNGWDADVIIHDIKTAILWNGKWHYEKICEGHSVEQVQNRDRIKIEEIEKYGYIPYIIKDLGRHNINFVKKEFDKFVEHLILDRNIQIN